MSVFSHHTSANDYTDREWKMILRREEEVANLSPGRVHLSVLNGLPAHMRGDLWALLSRAKSLASRFSDKVYCRLQQCKIEEVDETIARDVYRTFPSTDMFREEDGYGQRGLLNLLRAYSVYDPEIGYCQGMGFIAGLLLMEMYSEELAFWTFVQIMQTYGWRNMFK